MNTTTTANEAQVLEGIRNVFFSYFDEGVSAGSHTWSDEFAFEVADLLGISNQAAGGVISSMVQKNLFTAVKSSEGIALELTDDAVALIDGVRA